MFSPENARDGVVAAYSEVHQIFQIALAAHEAQLLERFYCSVFDAPGTWGGRLSRVLGAETMGNRRRPEIPVAKVTEYPWPFLKQRLGVRARLRSPQDWGIANDEFDKWVARQLKNHKSRVFVGVETCARDSLKAAKQQGMVTVLDCHQAHPVFLEGILAEAADDLELPPPPPIDTPAMEARKKEEFEMADYLLVLSEVEERSYLEAGIAPSRLMKVPLWADPLQWFPPAESQTATEGPLKVLFVGRMELRKGIPYLLKAARACGKEVQLSLIGVNPGEVDSFLNEYRDDFISLPPQSKNQLRQIYAESDVLVLPSLVDTFGFVAMEAMACGTPVIVSENCGVPVPDESWRVPVMNHERIVERLLFYARNREVCREDGRVAARFAPQWTPEVYRSQIGAFLKTLVN